MALHSLGLLLVALLPMLIAGQQSIQGFIYWDEDFNGVLTEGVLNPYGTYVRELENGVVNVRIEVNRCGSGELVTKGLSGWLSTSIELPSTTSKIHSSAGYYKIDVGEKADESGLGGCLLDDEDLNSINGASEDDDGTDSSKRKGGCYLVVSSPKDMEITTTFPLPFSHGFYGSDNMESKEMDSIENDIFSWWRYKDMGPFTEDALNGNGVVSRGYQTRTRECFGYNTDNKKWYVWKDPSLVDEDDEAMKATQVEIPNTRMYGYDRYLTLNSYNYDGVLSISPVGMSENLWPLPLRVKSDVYLGMKFDERKALNGRFQYEPTSENEATAASTFRPYQALTDTDEAVSSVFSSDGGDTTDGYVLENPDGILADLGNLEEVVQSFLKREALNPSRASGLDQMMISLNVVGIDQWSMVKITDNKAPSSDRRHLRGVRSPQMPLKYTSPSSFLRSGNLNHRALIMEEPHMIFHFQVYATYSSRASADVSSIIKTTNGFGSVIESAINTKREDLLQDIRKRTGFDGPECTVSSSNDTNATSLESYSIIDFDLDTDSDSSKTLECQDRIPLFFYDINALESRGATNHNASLYEKIDIATALGALKKPSEDFDVLSVEEETDSSGNNVLIYAALSALAGISIAAFGVGWVIYERKRRAKLRKQRRLLKEQRKAKKMKKKLLEEKNPGKLSESNLHISEAGSGSLEKSNSNNALETSHKSSDERVSEKGIEDKNHDDSSDDDDDSEIERLFDDSSKTRTTDLEQSNFNLSHNASRKSGLDISSSRENEERPKKANPRQAKQTKLSDRRSRNAVNRSNRFSAAMAGLRQSTTHMILGKLDTSDSNSDSSDGSSSSSSESEAEDHKNEKSSRVGQQPRPPTRNRRKMITSAINNVRSSITRGKNPTPLRNGEHSSRKRTTVSRIRSSLKKKKPIPNHDSSSSSSSSDDESSNSSAEKGPKKREQSPSHVKPDIIDDSSSSSSSSDSSVDFHKSDPNVASRPIMNRRASESSLMMKRNNHEVDNHTSKETSSHFRTKSLPDAASINEDSDDENGGKQTLSRMQSDRAPRQKITSSRPSLQKHQSQKYAASSRRLVTQSDGAPKKSVPSSRPSLQKHQSHRHVASSRHLVSRHGDDTKMHKFASERKLEVPLHELKPSKAKPSRQLHRGASERSPKDNDIDRGQAMAKAKSTRQLKSEHQPVNQELHDSVVTNKAAYLPQDLKPEVNQREHGPKPSLNRTNSDRSKSSNDLERSSSSRISSRPSTKSDLEGKDKKPRKSRKGQNTKKIAKDVESSQKKPRRRRTAALEKLKSSLKSSIKSTVSGNKLSGAALSTLADAEPREASAKHSEQKASKARSMKSSRSALVSEKSSSNLKDGHKSSTGDGKRKKRATTRH